MRNEELRARYDELVVAFERTRRKLDEMRAKVAELRGTAQSPDGLVGVTVGPRGELAGLTLSPRTYRHLGPDQLAETVLATTRAAVADLTARAGELYAPFLPSNVDYAQVRSGEVDPAALAPREPLTVDNFRDWFGAFGVGERR